MKTTIFSFILLALVLIVLYSLDGGSGFVANPASQPPSTSAPTAPSEPQQGGSDPFGSLKVN